MNLFFLQRAQTPIKQFILFLVVGLIGCASLNRWKFQKTAFTERFDKRRVRKTRKNNVIRLKNVIHEDKSPKPAFASRFDKRRIRKTRKNNVIKLKYAAHKDTSQKPAFTERFDKRRVWKTRKNNVIALNLQDSDQDGVYDVKDKCPDTPQGVKVDVSGCPLDSDEDGVADYLDKCPDTLKGVKVDANGCPLDSDGDGVADYLDKCPDTLKGVKVDAKGCPLDSDGDGVADYLDKCPDTPQGVRVDVSGCPLDSDEDGVADYLDKCPDTPQGVKVDVSGCPLDSDEDGVADYLDKCPDTLKGVKVDAKGCFIPQKVSISLKVEFDTNKYNVKPIYFEEIKKFADFMQKYPETTITIEGHTDNTGKKAYNMNLSQKRADSVKQFFIEKFGIDGNRIKAVGYGPEKPIADNKTIEGRQRNRRIETVIEVMTKQ